MEENYRLKSAEHITTLIPRAGSTAEFAKSIGTTARTVNYWLTGERFPSAESVYKMSSVYGVSADYVLGLSDDRTLRHGQKRGLFARIFG